MDKKANGHSVALAVVALLAGVLIGVVVASSFDMGDTTDVNTNQQTAGVTEQEVGTYTALHDALTQHVSLAAPTLRNVFDNAADTEASAAALEKNSDEVIKLVTGVAGEDAGAQFGELWRNHIGFFVDYTVAAREGDQAGMDEALANLDNYAAEVSALLASATGLDQAALEQGFSTHIDQVINAVNAYGAGNYEESYNAQLEAEAHLRGVADLLAGAITSA